jgi:hypothetical protein
MIVIKNLTSYLVRKKNNYYSSTYVALFNKISTATFINGGNEYGQEIMPRNNHQRSHLATCRPL